MSEKQSDTNKLIDKMRTNTEQQNRKTEAKPWRRTRKKIPKSQPMKPVSEAPSGT